MSTAPLFLVDALPTGDTGVLDGPEGRHAATVKRLRPGEELLLADGRGGLAHAVVEDVAKDALGLRVVGRSLLPAPAPRVVLAQALVKGDRGELAVELATEAGVDAVLPWRAARCVARWEAGPRGEKALARWRTTAREAAKQARRPWVPVVEEPVTTAALAERVTAAAGGAGAARVGRRGGSRTSPCPPTATCCWSSARRAGSPTTSSTRWWRPGRRRCGWGRRCCGRRPRPPWPWAHSGCSPAAGAGAVVAGKPLSRDVVA